MIDVVQWQKDIVGILASSSLFANIHVVAYRDECLKEEIDLTQALTKPKNGRTGAAVVVMMPTASNARPAVTGPIMAWQVPVVALEYEFMNRSANTGALITCEDIAQRVADVLHLHADAGLGTLTVTSVSQESEIKPEGCRGLRVGVSLPVGKSQQTERVALPIVASVVDGTVTLSCQTVGAAIWYTMDGTFPCNADGGNPGSKLYAAPFSAVGPVTLRVRAYKDGLAGSAVNHRSIE